MERLDIKARYQATELAIHLARYEIARSLVPGKRVLDVGCGEGYGAAQLANAGAEHVVGIDVSASAIAKAREAFRQPRLEFRQSAAEELSPDAIGVFDVIICLETFEHVADPRLLLETIKRVAHAETRFIISCPNDAYYYGAGKSLNPFHLDSYSFEDFRSITESVLGAGDWLLGAPLAGFGCFELSSDDRKISTYAAAIASSGETSGRHIPISSKKQALTPATALFYVGVWPKGAGPGNKTISFAANADFRLPVISSVSKAVRQGRKPRLAFAIDQPDWAFDNIARNIGEKIEGRYEVDRIYTSERPALDSFAEVFSGDYDNIHFMWREPLFRLLRKGHLLLKLMEAMRVDADGLVDRLCRPVITTTIYDHLRLDETSVAERRDVLPIVDAYSTASRRLFEEYAEKYPMPPATVTHDGVDTDLFRPHRIERLRETARPFVVGWAGNSRWGDKLEGDPKGLRTVVIPAVEIARSQGLDLIGHFADRAAGQRSRLEMATYYSEIDVLVIASSIEGTPNPLLEAMACGVPVITTDVGVVPEALGPKQRRFILKDRNPETLAAAIAELAADPGLRVALSEENLAAIGAWTWTAQVPDWLRLFRDAEARHGIGAAYKRYTFFHVIAATQAAADSAASEKEHRVKLDKRRRRIEELTKIIDDKKASGTT